MPSLLKNDRSNEEKTLTFFSLHAEQFQLISDIVCCCKSSYLLWHSLRVGIAHDYCLHRLRTKILSVLFAQPIIDKCHIGVSFWLISFSLRVLLCVNILLCLWHRSIRFHIVCAHIYMKEERERDRKRNVCVVLWKSAHKIIWHFDRANARGTRWKRKNRLKDKS